MRIAAVAVFVEELWSARRESSGSFSSVFHPQSAVWNPRRVVGNPAQPDLFPKLCWLFLTMTRFSLSLVPTDMAAEFDQSDG